MSNAGGLPLSIAIGNYDRIRPIRDGQVRIDGVDPVFMLLEPEEIFFRAFRSVDFDICELSLSSFSVKQAAGTNPYVGVPVFPSRMFRHNAFYVNINAGIARPEDLRGKRIGLPEYQLTACVWARIILDEYGVRPEDVTWVRGGMEEAGRIEKISLDLPAGVRLENAPADKTLSGMLDTGEIDAILGPRAPRAFEAGEDHVRWLFPDPVVAAKAWYEKTGIFPIMHVLGIRKTLVEQHPWLPSAVVKAFNQSRDIAVEALFETAASRISLPFVEESARSARALLGPELWSYGFAQNRHVLETFLEHHHRQGLSKKRLSPEDLFHPATLETFKI
ncbi:ABC transporter substrate-binding protein [Novosphingobium sp. MW5]|nr:ABC transporter substrate-binding protein [Novosphingobium sp. MW5]